ncbi:MAG TPA: sugar ABC transporter permease [Chloroflexota bacterium]|nr:sugar ABC transporter permease [Chloroflexota bacterium]
MASDVRPIPRSRQRSLWGEIWAGRVSYLFILPALLSVLIFMVEPTFSGFYYAFTDWNPGFQEVHFVGLDNFAALFQDATLGTGVRNVLEIVVATVLKNLTVPLLVAELIFHLRSPRLQYWLRTLFVVPMVMPAIAVILLWIQIYDPNIGLLNQLLGGIGLQSWQHAWLGDPLTALPAIIFVGFPWVHVLPFLILLGGLMSIPQELYDAATVDGARASARFLLIDLPLLLGQIKLLVVLSVIEGFQGFYNILVMTGGGPFTSTIVPALEMYFAAFQDSKYGYACAIAFALFLVILLITIVNMTYLKSGVEYEA